MRIGVGVVTRGRPELLTRLLDSFVQLTPPSNASICFIVVENETVGTDAVASAVDRFKSQVHASKIKDSPVYFNVEPQLGIPFARNRALDMAVRADCDFLAFTDDDCRVFPHWIVRLLEAQQEIDADLTTSFVRYIVDLSECGLLQKIIAGGLLRKDESRVAKALNNGSKVYQGTGNWMIKMDFLCAHSLRFDESIGLMMAEDRQFYKDLPFRWRKIQLCPLGIRRRDYYSRPANSSVSIPPGQGGPGFSILPQTARGLLVQPSPLFYYCVGVLFRVLLVPFDRGVSFVWIIGRLGRVVGRIEYLLGRKVLFYHATTGE